MSLEEYQQDMVACTRCSSCKFIPQNQVKSWRFAMGCPSLSRYSNHAYSGGGRMIMGLSMLKGRSEMNDVVADIIYKCQLCGMCHMSCQVLRGDIDLADILLELRAKCVEDGFQISEHKKVLESVKKTRNTLGMPEAGRGDWSVGLELPDINQRQVKVFFHAGCRYSYDHGLRDTVRGVVTRLQKAGVNLGTAANEEACCCGRVFELGYREEMKHSADDLASKIKISGAEVLLTPCSDCYYAFKYLYPKNGLDLGVEVLHVTEYTDTLMKKEKLRPAKEIPMRVTYHDPCHLGRRGEAHKGTWEGEFKSSRPVRYKQSGREGIFDPPRDILRAIPGIDLVEMERIREYSWCCGAGGGVLNAFPDFAGWTARERLEEAKATGAEALVTACPWCVSVFKDAVRESGEDMKVYDVMELLDASSGGN